MNRVLPGCSRCARRLLAVREVGGGPENRTLQCRVWSPALSQSSLSPVLVPSGGAPGIRTQTERILSPSPLPIGLERPKIWYPRRDSNSHCSVPKTDASYQLGYPGMVRADGLEPPKTGTVTWSTAKRNCHSAKHANRIVKDRGGEQATRTLVSTEGTPV